MQRLAPFFIFPSFQLVKIKFFLDITHDCAFLQRSKALHEQTIPLLIPQQHMVIPHYMGKSKEMVAQNGKQEDNYRDIERADSLSSQSSFEDIPLLLPQEADELEIADDEKLNGSDITPSLLDSPSKTSRHLSFSFRKSRFEPSITDMQLRGFVDDHDPMHPHAEMSLDAVAQPGILHFDEWWETQERVDHVALTDEAGQVGSCTPCRCQVDFTSCNY